MINKLFFFILALSITENANCSPWDPKCKPDIQCKPDIINDGFYGGVNIGYTNLVGQLNRTLTVNTTDRVISLGENGIVSGVFVGYEKIIDRCIYIATEGFYQYADILIEKDEHTFPGFVNYSTYIKNEHKSGLVGKVGLVHYNNVFYIKTGLVLSRFILGFKDNTGNPSITSSASKVQKGIILGGGMDYFINKNFGIGIEYEITCYPSMNFKSNTVGSFVFKPYSHTFQVRFKYKF